ncbi:hypothetical protein MPER_07288, partial [Moniliophthora perniciosa FA553]
ELAVYDVPEEVLDVLRRSKVEHISIIGRRGPLEAAFTTKELREMMDLKEASMVPLDPALLEIGEGRKITRQQSRIVDLLKRGSKTKTKQKKSWSLEFYRNPLAVDPSRNILTLSHTQVDPNTGRAVPTGMTTQLPTNLIITSLGFPRFGHILKNVYSSGWAAMGAKGVLAATMMDAYSVVDGERGLLESLDTSTAESSSEAATEEELLVSNPDPDSIPKEVEEGLKKRMITTYKDWEVVNAEEIRRAKEGKERERMTSWEEVNNFLASRTDS